MIVDSSALTEQVVADVIASAFDSAGQRCSALRILCLQDDIADRTLAMLKGAMTELAVGNPDRLATDIGPVISARAQAGIAEHIERMRGRGFAVHQAPLDTAAAARGTFIAPALIELPGIAELTHEVFGPVLHVVRYDSRRLDALIAAINATGYGLTFGLHSRLDAMAKRVTRGIAAGNHYINRTTIGAVVGVQPFGGRGLSGTGPKAGGPLYLTRLAHGAVAALPAAPGAAPAPLASFFRWAEQTGNAAATSAARDYGRKSRLGQTIELPGPVGERNTYALHPRGRIAVLAASAAGLWRQVAAVLATGNVAVAVLGGAVPARPAGFPADLADHVVWADADLAGAAGLRAALVEGGPAAITAAARTLAGRDGPIVPLHADSPGFDIDVLLEEVAISINTTAAGGNASLMAMA